MNSISELTQIHEALDEVFAQHQLLVLRLDWLRALKLLKLFREQLDQHIRHEEEILLPVYETLAGEPQGGSAQQFRLEHRKIRSFLAEFCAQLEALERRGGVEKDAIKLLEEEAQFKHLMAHHDQRERTFLYRLLDERASPGKVLDMLNAIEQPGG